MTAALAQRLKTETRTLHSAAERSAFMGMLLRGTMHRPAYGLMLRNLHALYAALELALARHARHPLIAPVFLPALWRSRPLELDLQSLYGGDWADELALMPATTDQVVRIQALDVESPERLLAHAYVRYLGDLSGGQILRKIVADNSALRAQAALAFYDFGDAAGAKALAHAFRSGIDQVPTSAAQEDAVVDEAKLSFEWHLRLFDELASAGWVLAERAA
ncbi:MAG: biliverdin-producing heme oxygenase [Ideonella sp.]